MKKMVEKINFEKMNGLVPVVTIDSKSRKVLMVGFMNKEALVKTIENREMYYFSRTKKRLWKKGEESGNLQKLVSLEADCDWDSLIAEVKQRGVVCHEGKKSCFFNQIIKSNKESDKGNDDEYLDMINEVLGVIRARKTNPKKGSYVCKLLNEEINVEDKIMEEAKELIDAKKDGEIVWEAADLIFFILVYLVKNNISYENVLKELKRRRK